jgi:hypothetical protein
MSKPVLDQSGDTNFSELNRYARLYPFPDFAKQAGLADLVGPTEKKARLYADIRMPYQFPIHNKAATFVSTVYFLEKSAEVSPKVRDHIAARLSKAAEYWGIGNAVKVLESKHAGLNKEADHPDSSYAIVWATDDGRKERRYPMRNGLEVKAAAAWYRDYMPEIRKEYEFTDRQTIANKILQKAAEFGADIKDYRTELEQHAGRGLCSPTKAAEFIRDRVRAAYKCQPKMRDSMHKLADMVANRPKAFLDPGTMRDLANTVDQFDRTHGLLNKYSEAIPAPEAFLFEATYTKTAEFCKESCTLNTGSVYSKEDFTKLSTSDIRDLFGDDIADAVITGLSVDPEKMAEVAATFPRPDAQMFDELMSSKGIEPVAKQGAAQDLGFSFKELQEMSANA